MKTNYERLAIHMAHWKHPGWDMDLYTEAALTADDLVKNGFLIDLDPALLTRSEVQMTQKEIDALPQWDG